MATENKLRQDEKHDEMESLVRVFNQDLPGNRNILAALKKIKGISWGIANAVCVKINIDRTKKLGQLSKEDISKIENFLSALEIPEYMKNRRNDPETGETTHLYSTDLELKKEFDIKKLRKIKSYRGLRHGLKLPVRGQRTRSHFRKKGKAVGVTRKKK